MSSVPITYGIQDLDLPDGNPGFAGSSVPSFSMVTATVADPAVNQVREVHSGVELGSIYRRY
ncbi:hypothetical protein [Mycobacterium uberis]|uniref:hypothetical protein n=1 Tax=Mycobacterium uberis TaxID=2162698 RepID=UPI001FB22AEE|nr:hypothetical protein [Mycobacterium uberis]